MNYKYEIFGNEYQKLTEDIYDGIYKAHPYIDEELADMYARIAFYMIRKNKTKMSIHAPKKSLRRLKKALMRLKTLNETETLEDSVVDEQRKLLYIKK